MNKVPIKIVVTGASGRMGRKLITAIQKSDETILSAALINTQSELCGVDAGKLIGTNNIGIKLTSNINMIKKDFDILIDFSKPEATLQYLNFCYKNNKGIIIGTTGFDNTQKNIIKDASNKIGIVFTSNFSIGINLMCKLIKQVMHVISKSVDIDIIEAHHRNKVDVPSGTALMISELIAKILGVHEFNNCTIYNNNIRNIKRKNNTIGISAIRAGDIVGNHTVLFNNIGECLEITHKVSDRMVFAIGALRAAIWLHSQKNGLFDMKHVIE